MLSAYKAITFIMKRFFMKQIGLFFLMSFTFFSYSMDRAMALHSKMTNYKNPKIMVLNKDQRLVICCAVARLPIRAYQKKIIINGLKPKRKKRVEYFKRV